MTIGKSGVSYTSLKISRQLSNTFRVHQTIIIDIMNVLAISTIIAVKSIITTRQPFSKRLSISAWEGLQEPAGKFESSHTTLKCETSSKTGKAAQKESTVAVVSPVLVAQPWPKGDAPAAILELGATRSRACRTKKKVDKQQQQSRIGSVYT